MPTKHKPAHGRAMSKLKTEPDATYGAVVAELRKIVALLEKLIRPPPGPLPEPSEFVSGGFHRRSGDIYQSVAEPGTPNAGDVDPSDKEADEEFFKRARLRMPHDDDPSGSV